MPQQFGVFLRRLRHALDSPAADGASDGALLERYAHRQEEAAFAELLERHGPMILGVCRRYLGNSPDADDAFQATFLVLVRKAGSIAKSESIGSWLYGVAYRIALRAKTNADQRHSQQRQVEDMASRAESSNLRNPDLRPILDEEVQKLPAKYRQAVVLCYLEGRTTEQAAQQIGCPFGTVSSRLARARDLLRTRLTRRGLTVASAAVPVLFAENAAPAAVPAALTHATLTLAQELVVAGLATSAGVASANVSALTEGAIQAMWISKLKGIAAMLGVAVGLTGSALFVHQALAERPVAVAQTADTPKPAPEVKGSKADLTPATFSTLHTLVRPQANEWRHLKVQWLTDVVAARKKAAAEDKPILICYTGGAGYNEPLGVC